MLIFKENIVFLKIKNKKNGKNIFFLEMRSKEAEG